jgi:hypothetical protein
MRTLLRAASLVLIPGAALAHIAPPILRADRTLTITLGDRVTLEYVIRLSAPELSRVRRAGDLDRDGQLSRAEADRVLAGFKTELTEKVRYASGAGALGEYGRLAAAHPIAFEATGMEGPVDLPERAPGARIAWSFDLRIASRDDRLAIEDPSSFVTFDHSEVFVRDTAARRFATLGDAPERMNPTTQLAWIDAGKASTHMIHLTWTPAPMDKRPLLMIAVIAGGLAIIVVTVMSVRKRDEPPREQPRA